MNKNEFLDELENSLRGIPAKDMKDKELKREPFLQKKCRNGVSVFGIIFFNLVFILGPVVMAAVVTFVLYCVAAGIVIIGITWILSSIGQPLLFQWFYFSSITENTAFALATSIGTITAGFLLFIGDYYLSKVIYGGIGKYIKWNLRLNYRGNIR